MNVAFYAPLKSPDNPIPSGDRLIARMLIEAIKAGGHQVEVVSRLRTFDRSGDAQRQSRIARIGAWEAQRVLKRLRASATRPDVWLTYHLYHKAPDWIGPVVSREMDIPYCVAEASSSPRTAEGPWRQGNEAIAKALHAARIVFTINPKDDAGIRPLVGNDTRMVALAPFIDGAPYRAASANRAVLRDSLSREFQLAREAPWLLAVGMLRPGDKTESYRVLAEALRLISDRVWSLAIVGDGEARETVRQMFAGHEERVRFIGLCSAARVADFMAAADLLVWPAVNEAIGMVFIEGAMAGLPAVAANRPGIAAVIENGKTGILVPERDAESFASAVAALLEDDALRKAMGAAARARAASQNDLRKASAVLCRELESTLR